MQLVVIRVVIAMVGVGEVVVVGIIIVGVVALRVRVADVVGIRRIIIARRRCLSLAKTAVCGIIFNIHIAVAAAHYHRAATAVVVASKFSCTAIAFVVTSTSLKVIICWAMIVVIRTLSSVGIATTSPCSRSIATAVAAAIVITDILASITISIHDSTPIIRMGTPAFTIVLFP